MAITRPEQYHSVLKFFPPIANPPHEDPACLEKYWGRKWGLNNEVGTLRAVLVHRPGQEMEQIDESKWNDEVGALIGDNSSWYWRDRKGPDIAKMQEQHDHFCDVMRQNGVDVIYLDYTGKTRSRSIFTRDIAVGVPGGVVISRTGPAYRRGEEIAATQKLGSLGVPILRTIHGDGLFEGGNYTYLTPRHAAVGHSTRTNASGIRQMRETLSISGIELTAVPITGYGLHIDGAFNMVTEDTALVNITKLPFFFLELLQEIGIKTIDVHPDDNWYAINCLQLKPGKIIMCEGSERTADRLDKHGIEVIQIPYDEVLKNGGGPHCSTCPLIRDDID